MKRLNPICAALVVLPLLLIACGGPAAANPTAAPAATTALPSPTTAPAPTATAVPSPVASPTTAASASSASSTVAVAKDAKFGDILTGPSGMTLYIYTKDQPNISNCYDQCAQNWPPLLWSNGDPVAPSGVPGKLATATRKDGGRQVTYNGMPLYYWAKDQKPGDTTGQKVGYVWYVVPPTMDGFPTVKLAKDSQLGEILTDVKGMTIYRFTKDEPNSSTCYDQCAQNWPPLLVSAGDPVVVAGLPGTFGTTTRKDGAKQVTYNGMPLYYWAKDQKPGDTTGQNVGSVWFVINPSS